MFRANVWGGIIASAPQCTILKCVCWEVAEGYADFINGFSLEKFKLIIRWSMKVFLSLRNKYLHRDWNLNVLNTQAIFKIRRSLEICNSNDESCQYQNCCTLVFAICWHAESPQELCMNWLYHSLLFLLPRIHICLFVRESWNLN
jgi:hypothetical protein